MKKPLTRATTPKLCYVSGSELIDGPNPQMHGDCSGLRGNCTGLIGNCTGLWGDCSWLWGNCSGLQGDCSGLHGTCTDLWGDCSGLSGYCTDLTGNCTGLSGDLDYIPENERPADINEFVEEDTDNATYDKRHGGPYDRGAADSYYGRGFRPHYYLGATMTSLRIEMDGMTGDEIADYRAGFDDNEDSGNFKDWG